MQAVACYVVVAHNACGIFLPPSLIKTTIVIPFYAMGRDTRYFRNPQQFNPDRWDRDCKEHHPFASLPFGFGPRACYGLCLHMPMLCCTTLGLVYSCVCTHVLLCVNLCREEAGWARNVSLAYPGNVCVHVYTWLLCIIGFWATAITVHTTVGWYSWLRGCW